MAFQFFPIKYGHSTDLGETNQDSFYILGGLPLGGGIGSDSGFTSPGTGSTMIGGRPNSAAEVFKTDGTRKVFFGTDSKLYEWDGVIGNAPTDRSGTTYSAATAQPWSFAQWGDNTHAVNINNRVQRSTGSTFSDSASNAPKASIIVNAGPPSAPTLMVFDYDNGTRYRDGWYASALSNETSWTLNYASGCASGRLLEPSGGFTAAIPFRDGVVAFKKSAMYFGEYLPDGVNVWQWRRLSNAVGCVGKGAVCALNDVIYFAGQRGFYLFDGSYPQRLSGYVHDEWSALTSTLATDYVFASASDSLNVVRWTYMLSGGDSAGGGYCFNVSNGRWTRWNNTKSGGTTAASRVMANYSYGATYTGLPIKLDSGIILDCTISTPWIGNPETGVTLRGVLPRWNSGPTGAAAWAASSVGTFYASRFPYLSTASTTETAVATLNGDLHGMAAGNYVQAAFTIAMSTAWQFDGLHLDLARGSKR
jgi:hypothetical protein